MHVLSYLHHRALYWMRHPSHGGGTLAGQIVVFCLLVLPMSLFVYGPLASVGWFLPDIVAEIAPETTALDATREWFLWSFVALIPVRFLMHSPTGATIPAYLLLPLKTRTLVHTRLALELVSLHTLVPFSIGIPVLIRVIAPSLSPLQTAAWGLCLVAATAAYTYAGILLNEMLGHRSRLFWSVAAGTALLFALDWMLSIDGFLPFSAALMSRPVAAALVLVGAATSLYAWLFQLRQTTYVNIVDASTASRSIGPVDDVIAWIGTLGEAGKATALELRLITRHRRTRGMCLLLLLGGPLICYAFALTKDTGTLLLTVQYMSLGFPFTYGIILFSGDHKHLEGLLARSSDPAILVRGKVQAMQIMNAVLFALMGPALAFLPLEQAVFLCAWLPYGLFIVAPLSVYFAASTSHPIDLNVSSFAPQTSSFHMLPLALPLLVAFVVVFLEMSVDHWSLSVLPAVMGGMAAVAVPTLLRATTRKLERRKYRLLDTFRSARPT